MKIRHQFVSNSSSTSFVVLLPENFCPETVDLTGVKEQMSEYEVDEDGVREGLRSLISNDQLWEEECYDSWFVISELLSDYRLAGIDTGPDAGVISLADRSAVKKVLDNEK